MTRRGGVASTFQTSLYSGIDRVRAKSSVGHEARSAEPELKDGRHSVLFRKSRLLVGIALATAALFGQATDWVDRGEYELVAEQIGKATDPAKKLELLM